MPTSRPVGVALLSTLEPRQLCCRERLRANPSLVNCCTIDWLGPPPADALEAVAHKQLSELTDVDVDTHKSLVGLCQAIHVQVGANKTNLHDCVTAVH